LIKSNPILSFIGFFIRKTKEKIYLFKTKESTKEGGEVIKASARQYAGKVVTWKCIFFCERSYDFLPYFGPLYMSVFHLNADPSCPVVITGILGIRISKGDSVLITGKVHYVTRNGEIRLIPIRIEQPGNR
jgi:hypothetical protein